MVLFLESIKKQTIPQAGKIGGVFVEKSASYRFTAIFDSSSDQLQLNFYSHLNDELVFSASRNNGENSYEFFLDSFFSVKIGILLETFEYLVSINTSASDLYLTTEDFYVIVDGRGNYYKYDDKFRIIKKENRQITVKYLYQGDQTIDRIEINQRNLAFHLIVEEITNMQMITGDTTTDTGDVTSDG